MAKTGSCKSRYLPGWAEECQPKHSVVECCFFMFYMYRNITRKIVLNTVLIMKCCIGNLWNNSSQFYCFLKLKLWNVIREMEKYKAWPDKKDSSYIYMFIGLCIHVGEKCLLLSLPDGWPGMLAASGGKLPVCFIYQKKNTVMLLQYFTYENVRGFSAVSSGYHY